MHAVNGQMLITLCIERKLLPAAMVKEATHARAAEVEEQQGFKPGRKQMREIKDAVTDELLPKAFSIRTKIAAWIGPANGWPAIDAPSSTKADALTGYLFKSVDKLELVTLRVKHAPVAAMTEWLATDSAPAGFTIDQDAELRATGEGRATVRYVQHTLASEDVSRHIAAGKRCTHLAMTWNDRVSFVLTDGLTLKRVAALDVIKETAGATEQTADEAFDGDFLLMAGEQVPAAPNDLVSAAEDAASPASGEPDPLYPQAVDVIRKAKRASISLVQRHLRIGYKRAARLLEQMEGGRIVSPMGSDGSRKVLAGATSSGRTWNTWSPEEEAVLKQHWNNRESTKRLATRLPGRSTAAILKHGYDMGLGPRNCGRESFSPVWEGVKRFLAGGQMMTARELAAALKVTAHAVQCMRDRHGTEVHVGGYAKVAAHSTRVNRWKLGAGPDAPLPHQKSKKEVNRDYSRRMWKDPEYCARENPLARLRYAEKKGNLIRPDAAVQWMLQAPQHDAQPLRAGDGLEPAGAHQVAAFPRAGLALLASYHTTSHHAAP